MARCYYHSGEGSVGTCSHCGHEVCSECNVLIDGKHHCKKCIEDGSEKGK